MFKNTLDFIFASKIRKILILSLIAVLSLLISVFTVFANRVVFDASLDNTDTFGTVASSSGSGCSSVQSATYDAYIFEVDIEGVYTMETTLGTLSDSVLNLYSPILNSSNPLNNCLESDDDDGVGIASKIVRTLTANTRYTLIARGFGGALGTYSLSISGPGTICSPNCDGLIPAPAFADGRINNYDTAAPIAVYPHDINGETGLIIYDVNGVELLIISPQQILAAPENPDSNLLIAQANGVALYRLAGGLWQINAPQYNGKTYVMIFSELFYDGGYESHEIDN